MMKREKNLISLMMMNYEDGWNASDLKLVGHMQFDMGIQAILWVHA